MRHGDSLTRWFEDAVDEADDAAERKSAVVFVERKPRNHKITVQLTEDERAMIDAMAAKEAVPPAVWMRERVLNALDLLKAGE